jgi:Fic family protein
VRRSQRFNHRQIALIGHALRNPYAEYTVRSHSSSHNVTRQTARTDLVSLTEVGLLTQVSAGRGFAYYPPEDLQSRLEAIGTESGSR